MEKSIAFILCEGKNLTRRFCLLSQTFWLLRKVLRAMYQGVISVLPRLFMRTGRWEAQGGSGLHVHDCVCAFTNIRVSVALTQDIEIRGVK